jgi:hypothetical protein
MLDDMEAPPVEDTAGQTVTHLTITDFDETVIPKKSATVGQCKEALQQVAAQFSILDRKTGWMAWLKGKILLRAQDACGGENSKEWKQFCKDIAIPKSSRYLYISIAKKYKTKKQVEGKTLTELRDHIDEDNGNGKSKGKGKAKGKGKGKEGKGKKKQTLSTLPGDLDTTLQVLDSAIKMELGNAKDEDNDPATAYGNCISQLQQIEQRARACIAEFETRIHKLKSVTQIEAEQGKSLRSRTAP